VSNPALLTLTAPLGVPAAAAERLLATSVTLKSEGESIRADRYSAWLLKMSVISEKASALLPILIAGNATEAETAGMMNVERIARAGAQLFGEVASRSQRRPMVDAMLWATLHRSVYSDVSLTRREFAPASALAIDWVTAQSMAPIRILPGAEPTLSELMRDPIYEGHHFDVASMTGALVNWVTLE